MEDAWFEGAGVFMSALPFIVFALAAGMMGSGLLVAAPTVFVRNVGVVGVDDALRERRKFLFSSMLVLAFVMFSATWWFFTQAELVIAAANNIIG